MEVLGKPHSVLYEFILIFYGIIVFSIGYVVKAHFTNVAILYDSLKTPWGVITAMFVYDGDANIIVYALFADFFIGANAAYDRSIRAKRYLLTICLSICAALLADIANLGLYALSNRNGSGFGQSGIVYGFIGAVTAVTLFDFLTYLLILIRRVRKKPIGFRMRKMSDRRSRRVTTGIFTIFILLFSIFYALIDPRNFFSIAPGVDSFVHLVSFAIGAIFSIYLIYKYRTSLTYLSPILSLQSSNNLTQIQ